MSPELARALARVSPEPKEKDFSHPGILPALAVEQPRELNPRGEARLHPEVL